MSKPCECGHLKGEHRDSEAQPDEDGRSGGRNTTCHVCVCSEYTEAPRCAHDGAVLQWAADAWICPKCGDEWTPDYVGTTVQR